MRGIFVKHNISILMHRNTHIPSDVATNICNAWRTQKETQTAPNMQYKGSKRKYVWSLRSNTKKILKLIPRSYQAEFGSLSLTNSFTHPLVSVSLCVNLSLFIRSISLQKLGIWRERVREWETMNRHHDPNPFEEEEVNPFSVILSLFKIFRSQICARF